MKGPRIVNKNNCYILDNGWLATIIDSSDRAPKGCVRTDKLRKDMTNLDVMTYIIYREHWKYKITYYTNIWTGLATML